MPRRHTYITRFRCPKCKKAGNAKWEENDRIALPHGAQNSGAKQPYARLPKRAAERDFLHPLRGASRVRAWLA